MKYNSFWNSYYKYLEIKDDEKICLRKRKEIINNKFHYPIIISFIDNRVIYSVEKNYYENFIKDINIFDEKNLIFVTASINRRIGLVN